MSRLDPNLLKFASYEDYLSSFMRPEDHIYFSSLQSIQKLMKLGYRSAVKVYEKHEFDAARKELHEMINPKVLSTVLYSNYFKGNDAVLQALADREEPNMVGKLSTIIFMQVRQRSGFDISGYIDYEKSLRDCNLKTPNYTNWKAVFEGRILLRPKPNDLSYYDWHKGIVNHTDTDNFQADREGNCLIFKHKVDHKLIPVTNKPSRYSNNVYRFLVRSELYGLIILYDHVIR